MFKANPDGSVTWDFGGAAPSFGSSSFGYSPGSGEFGADPYALSQTTREQWEMVPGHRGWYTTPAELYFELTGRTDYRREKLVNRPDLQASNRSPDLQASNRSIVGLPNSDTGYVTDPPVEPKDILIGETLYRAEVINGCIVLTPYETMEVIVTAPRDDPPPPSPASYWVTVTVINAEEVHSYAGQSTAAPPSPAFAPTPTGSAVPGARPGAASGVSEWLYKDSLGILYNGGRGDAFKQTLPVDTGSILGNYAINTWLSLSNVVAGSLSAGLVITNTVDDFFNRHLGYGAIQTVLPMSKAMGIAVETGPAIEYSAARLSTWLSALSINPRVVNAALAPIFLPTLAVGGTSQNSTSAANLEHVLAGGSADRGIAVFHIDASRLTPTDLETAIVHVRDLDYQAGIADGLVRTGPSGSIAESVRKLARNSSSLSLGPKELAGHTPDVTGGGNPLGPIMGLPQYVNSSIAGQWTRYAPGFTFDGFSLIDRATGQFLYWSLGLEYEPVPILDFR